ncbi:MAG: tRNA (adenosine(37)-N6)-threonylcarbamoyltransferase complex ATPase subunit type 1 TsaE [bacterium]
MTTITNSEQQTMDFGKQLAHKLQGGDILLLKGELGAGKTTLVKGLAQGLGIANEITSPTFSLMNVYDQLIHIDTYRLKNEDELMAIGIEDYLGDEKYICVIEWPEKIKNLLKNKKIISVEIVHLDENRRKIAVIVRQ